MVLATDEAKFPVGRLLATPGALAALKEAGETTLPYIARHLRGEWGEVCSEDAKANNEALKIGARLLSTYRLGNGTKLWIITEADRSVTTVLLPEEY